MAELVSIKRNVDVSPGQAAPAVFHCSQGDVGSKIILGLLNNGTAYAIPSGVTVTIEGSESNGSIFTPISATASGSDITFNLTGEMTAVAGPAICQAVLKSGSNILGTANFTLEVESSPMGADAPPVFTDAGWTWMLNKLNTEFVPALGDNIIDAIDSKADQSDLTALSNTVTGHTGSIAVLNNSIGTINDSIVENRRNIDKKLDKDQGTANAGKYLKVGADGNVETADLDVTTDKTLSITDKAADAKAVGDELDDLKADLNDIDDRVADLETGGTGGLSKTAVNLLNTILGEAVYGTDQTANIELLYKELSNVKPVSITATLTSRALVGMAYRDLEFEITATFDDESTITTDKGYRVLTSGNVVSGYNTVTVSFRGVTTIVTFTAEQVTTYTMTYNLTDVSLSNKPSVVEKDERYEGTLSVADEDHYVSSVSVTMGGTDITSTVVTNNVITIAEVTGNVVITAVGSEYQYMDSFIRTRPMSKVVAYSDYLETVIFTENYSGAFGVSEYPALNDCVLHWKLTNDTENDISLLHVGFGSIPCNNALYPNFNFSAFANIPYCIKITNQSNKLAPGASIEGDYTLRAGHQLVFIALGNNNYTGSYDTLTVSVRGGFIPDTFNDFTQLVLDSGYPNYGSYRTITFYSGDGTGQIRTGGQTPYKVTDELAAGTYDVYYRIVNDFSKWAQGTVSLGAVNNASETVVNYAAGSEYILNYNIWFKSSMKVLNDGMTIISGTTSSIIKKSDNAYLDVRVKEVEE